MVVFSLIRTGFDPRPVHVGYLLDKVALGQVCLLVFRVDSVVVIPPKVRVTIPTDLVILHSVCV